MSATWNHPKKVSFQWSHLISNQSNKQQTNNKQTELLIIFTHIKPINTVALALQISKETLFKAGKSNCIENNEN